jgi:hypothetical protein
VLHGCSIVTSLPDISEFPSFSLAEWKMWFTHAAALTLASCPDDGVAIFYQTDIKREGAWVDKGMLCQIAAEEQGHALIAHKIVCRVAPGHQTFGRPAYSHMLCFSKTIRPAHAGVDVLPSPGETTWTRGMGVDACREACRFIIENTRTRTIVDPFCGHGTVLAIANDLGLNAIGVELNAKRARKARLL